MLKVIKFGGSSVANGTQIEKVINIIKSDPARRIIVVSAPGTRFKGDIKVTDLLIKYAEQTINNQSTKKIVEEIKERYQEIANYFELESKIIDSIFSIIDQLREIHYPSFDYLRAAFAAHGERLNAMLISEVLKKRGIDAKYVDPKEAGILVTDKPLNASIIPSSYNIISKVAPEEGKYIVVPGFFGYTKNGRIATFSRGGSDITGAIMASGTKADLYENFTDVNAILSVDPSIIPNAAPINRMTYDEMRELSYAGFAIFHGEAIIPAIREGIYVNVKNTNHPEADGTLIIPRKDSHPKRRVTGIAGSNRFCSLYIHKYLLNKEVGFTLRILKILKKYQVSYEHMPSGIDDITIIFDRNLLPKKLIPIISEEIKKEIDPDKMHWIDKFGIIMVVGEGMRNKIGTMSSIINALSKENINIQMINQGSSEISIMLGVSTEETKKAIKVIYEQVIAPTV